MGAGLALSYRANVWNIGCEGQFIVGAIAAGGLAIRFPDAPFWLLYPAMIVAGMAGGMIWAGIVALLNTALNVNEILSSLMLTYVAQFLLDLSRHRPVEGPAWASASRRPRCSPTPRRRPILVEGTERPSRLHRGAAGGDGGVAVAVEVGRWASSFASSAKRRARPASPASASAA